LQIAVYFVPLQDRISQVMKRRVMKKNRNRCCKSTTILEMMAMTCLLTAFEILQEMKCKEEEALQKQQYLIVR
jgi:hypothetical protein